MKSLLLICFLLLSSCTGLFFRHAYRVKRDDGTVGTLYSNQQLLIGELVHAGTNLDGDLIDRQDAKEVVTIISNSLP